MLKATDLRTTISEMSLKKKTQTWATDTLPALCEHIESLLELPPAQHIRLAGTTHIGDFTVCRYSQTINGIPVWADQISVTLEKAVLKRISGVKYEGFSSENFMQPPPFESFRAGFESMLYAQFGVVVPQDSFVSELRWYANDGEPQRLVYSVLVSGVDDREKQFRKVILVDASTGQTLRLIEALPKFDSDNHGGTSSAPQTVPGTAVPPKGPVSTFGSATATGPGGNQKTGRYVYGKDFPSIQVLFSNGVSSMEVPQIVRTVNLQHNTDGDTTYTFAGTDNAFEMINGAYCPLNDAHFFGAVVFDMYQSRFGMKPLQQQLVLRCHYSKNFENANWNGEVMTFGDGFTKFYPLVSLDVVCHEVSHGVTEQHSHLIYEGQSGGINEAFSDMAGEAAEFHASKKNDFLVGATIFKRAGALRYMEDPTRDGISIAHVKDYHQGMDVHHSSGVYNKAFYLLATSWKDTMKAFEVFLHANLKYWQARTDFVGGAKGVLDAAADLGYSASDVRAAFAGVGIAL